MAQKENGSTGGHVGFVPRTPHHERQDNASFRSSQANHRTDDLVAHRLADPRPGYSLNQSVTVPATLPQEASLAFVVKLI